MFREFIREAEMNIRAGEKHMFKDAAFHAGAAREMFRVMALQLRYAADTSRDVGSILSMAERADNLSRDRHLGLSGIIMVNYPSRNRNPLKRKGDYDGGKRKN